MALSIIWITLLVVAAIILFLPVAVIVYLILDMQYRVYKYRNIPSPKMNPGFSSYIFGHSSLLADYLRFQKPLAAYALDWAAECGPIMVIHLVTNTMVIPLTPEAVKEFLVSGNHKKDPKVYKKLHSLAFQRCLGQGLLTEIEPEVWEVKRNLFNPAFHRKYLRLSMNQFNASTDGLIKRLSTKADGKTSVKMLDEFTRATLDIISKVGFGFDSEVLTTEQSPIPDAIAALLHAVSFYLKHPWDQFLPTKTSSERRKYVSGNIRLLRDAGRTCIEKRIKDLQASNEVPSDILSFILKSSGVAESGHVEMEELLDEFVTFFIAGMETTANVLAALFLELSRNPGVKERMKEEVNRVMGKRTEVEFDDLHQMEYTLCAIKEALRLHPPANGTARMTSMDTPINGLVIPKSTSVMLMTYTMGRMECYFENALEFRPERFQNGEVPPYTYFPFSLGSRICIGQQFAMMEARVILAKLLRTFDFQWVEGQSYDFLEQATIKPKDGCQHYLTPLKVE